MTSIPIDSNGQTTASGEAGHRRVLGPMASMRGAAPPTRRARLTEGETARPRWKAGMLGAAVLGFLIGAVFWHVVGFWGFVRDVTLHGPVVEHRAVAQTGSACSALMLDRNTRQVQQTTCPPEAHQLVETVGEGKGDFAGVQRMAARTRWSVTVQANSEPTDEAEGE